MRPRRARGSAHRRRQWAPMVTRLVGPDTTIAAALGDESPSVPRLPLRIGFGPMLTFATFAPFWRDTGTPESTVHGHRVLATFTRFPPVPPKVTSAPEMLTADPPLTDSSGPFCRLSVLPLRRP